MTRLRAFLAVLPLACQIEPAPTLVARGDLDGDGRLELAEVRPTEERFLTIRRGDQVLFRGLPRRWRPWWLETGDIDGDGRPEITLGIVKATRFFPTAHNCLFIYQWDGDELVPRWLGSSLSRPFSAFTLADVDGDRIDEVVAVESAPGGGSRIAVYSWAGFGFQLDWAAAGLDTPRVVSAGPGSIVVLDRGEVRRLVPREHAHLARQGVAP